MNKRQMIENVSFMIMEQRGNTAWGPKHSEIEWDLSNPDSQLSMITEDVTAILEAIEEVETQEKVMDRLAALTGGVGSYLLDDRIDTLTSKHAKPVEPLPNVLTFVQITHQLADEPTISELREYVDKLSLLGLDDNFTLHGWLAATVNVENALVEASYNYDEIDGDSSGYKISFK